MNEIDCLSQTAVEVRPGPVVEVHRDVALQTAGHGGAPGQAGAGVQHLGQQVNLEVANEDQVVNCHKDQQASVRLQTKMIIYFLLVCGPLRS